MIYCEYCGHIITEGQNYCNSCGAPVTAEQMSQQTVSATAASAADPSIVEGSGDYSLVLVSLGSCSQAAAADLLEDTLGYTQDQSEELFSMLPAQAAQMLTQSQASYLAQAMTEYGMDVSVRNSSGYISEEDLDDSGQSVFASDGSFLSKVAGVIGLISGWNRMRKFRKLQNTMDYDHLFRREPKRPTPPNHVRRRTYNASPQPVRRPVSQSRPPVRNNEPSHPHSAARPGMQQRPQGRPESHPSRNARPGGPGRH